MSKYSNEFKLEVAKYCVDQYHGYSDAAKYFNIPSETTVLQWVRRYKEKGVAGLLKNKKSSYTGEFKQNVVEYMHINHLSATETAIKFNLANHARVLEWERIYYEEGPQALYKKCRGRSKNMGKNKLSKKNEEDLIEEVQRLRMENAYLKKLQALIQERTKPKQEKK